MLEVTNLRAGYGAINVLWDVSLTVGQGQLTTIIGPNGAGKTTLLRAIMGLIPIGQGQVTLEASAQWHADLGNVQGLDGHDPGRAHDLPCHEHRGKPHRRRLRPQHRARVKDNLERAYTMFPRLRERRRQLAGSLSGGEAQMLAMARADVRPKLLIIDEPSLGLAGGGQRTLRDPGAIESRGPHHHPGGAEHRTRRGRGRSCLPDAGWQA
jgi:branched-chain amino acid transport system ATP-binding protein